MEPPYRRVAVDPVSGPRAVALLALCVMLRVASFARPCLSDDEATYAVVAREVLAGQVIYRDVVDHKPPGVYIVNIATQALGGMALLHALVIVVVWATGLVLAAIARRYSQATRDGPTFVAILWIVFTTTLVDTDALAANCELLMMLPVVASVLLVLRAIDSAERELAPLFCAGLLVGVAMLFKYQAGVQLPLYVVVWLASRRRVSIRVLLGIGGLLLGAAIPIALTACWLASIDALGAAWFWFRFNFSYIGAGSTSAMLTRLIVRGGFVVLAAAPLYVFAVRAALRRPSTCRGLAHRILVLWLVVSAGAVMMGGRFFGHYFHQVTAPLVLLAAPGMADLWERRPRLLVSLVALPAAIFLGLGLCHDRFMAAVGEPDPDYARVVRWLDRHAPRSEALCIWGNSPVLYFEANRPLGCRFVFANYLTGMSPATATQTDPTVDSSANVVPEAWGMLEADLATRRPTFIVDASPGNVDYYGKWPPEKFPRLAAILTRDYTAVAQVAGMRIFRRRR